MGNPKLKQKQDKNARRAKMRRLNKLIEYIKPRPEYLAGGIAGCLLSGSFFAYSLSEAISLRMQGQDPRGFDMAVVIAVGLITVSAVVWVSELNDYRALKALKLFKKVHEVPPFVVENPHVNLEMVRLLAELGSKNAQGRIEYLEKISAGSRND